MKAPEVDYYEKRDDTAGSSTPLLLYELKTLVKKVRYFCAHNCQK